MAVVVDSAASLPADLTDQLLTVVPMAVIVEGESHLDGIDLSSSDLYRMLSSRRAVPTTSAPSPEAFYSAFITAADYATSALCVTVASRFSASSDSARLAAGWVREKKPGFKIAVLDSGSAAGGEGLVTMATLEAVALGGSLDDVAAAAKLAAAKVRLVAYVDTLYYLWKGGRLPGVAHKVATQFDLKPLFEMSLRSASNASEGSDELELEIVRRVPARSARRAQRRLVEMVEARARTNPIRACLMHAGVHERVFELEQALRQAVDCESLYVAEFSPVMGVHIGPGALGIAYLPC